MGNLTDLVVLCDGESDRRLFCDIAAHHPLLSKIGPGQVRTYDQARHLHHANALEHAIRPLHVDDRPDWIFCVGDRPVLVVEMTQHAYTGDNGLQRFARFAAAAENQVPFIYFGPRARVRDDELDLQANPARRNLTSDLYEGMRALSRIYSVPQLYIEWKTDGAGLPAALPFRPSQKQVSDLFGELLNAIASCLSLATSKSDDFLSDPEIFRIQESTNILADKKNTRESEVRFKVEAHTCQMIVRAPSSIIDVMGANYFSKGKPDKLLAELCLRISDISAVQMPDGAIIHETREVQALLDRILNSSRFQDGSRIFYTGYKWRSDPHAGVLVNYDVRTREVGELVPYDRKSGLIVVYPRVSLRAAGPVAQALAAISVQAPGPLLDLFARRYGKDAKGKLSTALDTSNAFGIWRNSSKQARIFRRYADLVVLNDAVVVGDSLGSCLKDD